MKGAASALEEHDTLKNSSDFCFAPQVTRLGVIKSNRLTLQMQNNLSKSLPSKCNLIPPKIWKRMSTASLQSWDRGTRGILANISDVLVQFTAKRQKLKRFQKENFLAIIVHLLGGEGAHTAVIKGDNFVLSFQESRVIPKP